MKLPEGYVLREYEVIGSTSAEARKLAESLEHNQTLLVWAKRQTSGRGRYDREWISEPGNFYTTLLLYPDVLMETLPQLSFVAALAARDACHPERSTCHPEHSEGSQVAGDPSLLAQDDIHFKWPNDLLLKGRKAGGILLESGMSGDKRWVAIGVGINLASHPENVMHPATHLAAEGINLTPEALLEQFATAFKQWYEAWRRDGFAVVCAAWLRHADGINKAVEVRLPNHTLRGIFIGMREDGALLLRLENDETRAVAAGDVFLMSASSTCK